MAREVSKQTIEAMTAAWSGCDLRTVRKVLAGKPVKGHVLPARVRSAREEVQKMIASLEKTSEPSGVAA